MMVYAYRIHNGVFLVLINSLMISNAFSFHTSSPSSSLTSSFPTSSSLTVLTIRHGCRDILAKVEVAEESRPTDIVFPMHIGINILSLKLLLFWPLALHVDCIIIIALFCYVDCLSLQRLSPTLAACSIVMPTNKLCATHHSNLLQQSLMILVS